MVEDDMHECDHETAPLLHRDRVLVPTLESTNGKLQITSHYTYPPRLSLNSGYLAREVGEAALMSLSWLHDHSLLHSFQQSPTSA